MGIQKGRLTLSRYRVIGRQGRLSLSDLNKKFARGRAAPVEDHTGFREIRYGWILPDWTEAWGSEPDTRHWDMSHCRVEQGFLLRMRLDRRKIPGAYLQEIFRSRVAGLTRSSGKAPGRREKKAILENLKEELIQATLPTITTADVFWQDDRDEIVLMSGSQAVRDAFSDLFRKTFGEHLNLSLVPIMPPLLGIRAPDPGGKEPERYRKLHESTPAVFHPTTMNGEPA